MYVLEFEWGFGWAVFSPQVGRASGNWNILIKGWNALHLWDWQHAFLSFGSVEFSMARSHRGLQKRNLSHGPGMSIFPRPRLRLPRSRTKGKSSLPLLAQPSPSTGSLSKKTCFTDALTKLHWIWLTYGLPAVSGSREKKSSPNQDPKSFFLKGTLERWQKDREGRSRFLKHWVTTRLRNFSLLTLVILAKATFQDVSLFKSTKVLTSCLTLAFSWETGRVIHVFLSPWPFFVSRLSQQFERGLR